MTAGVTFHERIEELLEQVKRKKTDEPLMEMHFNPQAEFLWFSFAKSLENEISQSGYFRDVSKWANRTLDNVSRMAALIEYYTYGGENKNNLMISEPSLKMAIDLGTFWLNEAKLLFGDLSTTAKQISLAKKLMEYYVRKHKTTCTPVYAVILTKKDIYTNGPRELRSSEASQSTIDFLLQQQYLEAVYESYIDADNKLVFRVPANLMGYRMTVNGSLAFGGAY